MASISQTFHVEHKRLYGHSDDSAPLQVVALRLVITSRTPKPGLREITRATGAPVPSATLQVWLDGMLRPVSLYRRVDLLAGHAFEGPAIVAQDDCTTAVLAGYTVAVDAYGNLEITASGHAGE